MAIAPLTGYAAAALSPVLVTDLHIRPAQFGMFATVSFLSAAAFSLLLSRTIHRLSELEQILIIFTGAALCFVVLGYARNLAWVLAAAALCGPAHALSNPFTNRIVADRILAEARSKWMGVKQSGVQCSQAFAGIVLPATAMAFGWRSSFIALALVSFALLLWVRSSFSRYHSPGPAMTMSPMKIAAGLARAADHSRNEVRAFAAYALFSGAGMQATNVYLPLFAREALHLSAIASGITVAVAGGVGLCARILWGRSRNLELRAGLLLRQVAIAASTGVLCLAVAEGMRSSALLWIGVVLHGATAIGSNVIVMVGLMGRVPASQAGAASATVSMGMYLGFALGPLLMSGLLFLAGDFSLGWCLVAACYAGSFAAARHMG